MQINTPLIRGRTGWKDRRKKDEFSDIYQLSELSPNASLTLGIELEKAINTTMITPPRLNIAKIKVLTGARCESYLIHFFVITEAVWSLKISSQQQSGALRDFLEFTGD